MNDQRQKSYLEGPLTILESFQSLVSWKRLYISELLCFDLKGTTVDMSIWTRQLTLCTFTMLRILNTATQIRKGLYQMQMTTVK